jgi:hypothetical protein
VIAVGATTLDGTRWPYSNYGAGLDLVAPGDLILSTDRTGSDGYDDTSDYIYDSGTSYASPLAAATAALILSKNPGLTPAQVKSAMKNTARYLGSSSQYGSGLLEPTAAVDAVAEGVFYAAGFTNSTGGWKSQAKFGWLVDEKFPYFHHKDHGEQYTSSTDPDNMWVYDYQSSSWWLIGIGENGLYPWIWKSDESTWYFYQKDTCCPRWFKNQITGQWVNF